MSKRLITLFFFLCFLSFSAALWAQDDGESYDNEKGTSMKPIVFEAITRLKPLEEQGYEIVRMEFDIVSDVKTTYRTLTSSWEYTIVAFGDYRCADIDLLIYKKVGDDWELFKKDTGSEAYAKITFKPDETAQFRFDVKVERFKKDWTVAHYGLFVLHE